MAGNRAVSSHASPMGLDMGLRPGVTGHGAGPNDLAGKSG